MARRSISMVNSCWPDKRSMRMSRAPRVDLTIRATCSDNLRNSSRSSPKILTATCERTPVTISSTRCSIGCDSTIFTPGSTASALRISSSISCWVRPDPSRSSAAMGSDSFCDAGSAGDSPRPSLDTTRRHPRHRCDQFHRFHFQLDRFLQRNRRNADNDRRHRAFLHDWNKGFAEQREQSERQQRASLATIMMVTF